MIDQEGKLGPDVSYIYKEPEAEAQKDFADARKSEQSFRRRNLDGPEPDTGRMEKLEEAIASRPAETLLWTTAPDDANAPVLSKKAQLDNAKQFARDKLILSARGRKSVTGTHFFQGKWWHWNGSFYEKAPEQRITDMACEYLDKASLKTDEGLTKFKPSTKDLSALMTFLRTNVGLDDRITPPTWLDERASPKPEELLAFRNCLVDVTTGKTYHHEPWLWMHDGVDFNYDPKAHCPWWEWMLNDQFPKDEEARDMIEEELGYGMTLDNQFEKAALWIGPARSGRGTIAYIQELLVGPNGYTSLNIHSWHNNENSRMGMIGKRVGIFHDVRLKPGQWYGQSYAPGGLDPQSQQLLLELISGDRPRSDGSIWRRGRACPSSSSG